MALGINRVDQDSAAKGIASIRAKLAKENAARERAQADVEALARAVEDVKKTTDSFVAQIPTLEKNGAEPRQQGY
jgi:predicted  nucleic acid-binding Zn-ribbon protein